MGCPVSKYGPIGWLVNGIALYGWSDGQSYNGFNVWQNLIMEFEKFDLDVCKGQATAGSPYHRKRSMINTSVFLLVSL